MTIGIGLPSAGYPDVPKQAAFYDRLLTDVRTLPGVDSAAAVTRLPLLGFVSSTNFTIQSKPVPLEIAPNSDYRAVTQDYFKSMGIPLLEGRDFNDREMKDAQDVIIINKLLAERFFPAARRGMKIIVQFLTVFPCSPTTFPISVERHLNFNGLAIPLKSKHKRRTFEFLNTFLRAHLFYRGAIHFNNEIASTHA